MVDIDDEGSKLLYEHHEYALFSVVASYDFSVVPSRYCIWITALPQNRNVDFMTTATYTRPPNFGFLINTVSF